MAQVVVGKLGTGLLLLDQKLDFWYTGEAWPVPSGPASTTVLSRSGLSWAEL